MLIRSFIIYLVVFVVVRLMGKRQIGEMQPFELVITLIIADLACIPMAEMAVPLSHGVVPILVLLIVHFFICFFARKSMLIRYIFSGKPTIVISPKGINYDALKKLNMNLDDLIESMRGCDVFSFENIAYAIIETNGTMCILPKKSSSPATCEDVGVSKPKSALPMAIIMDGRLMPENIRVSGVTDVFVSNCLKKIKQTSIKHILIMTIDNNGKVFIQPKHGHYQSFDTNFTGGDRW